MTLVSGQVQRPYGDTINEAFLEFIGTMHGTVVDIGSGRGGWVPHLRKAGAERVLAVEPSDDAEIAKTVYDDVFRGTTDDLPPNFLADANLLIAADVLEHLLDPWSTLQQLREGVSAGTQLAISLPNVQCARYLLRVLLRGHFYYSDEGGWLDRGHLRWFSRRTLTADLEQNGWRVVRADGKILGRVSRTLYRITGGKARDMAFYQLHVLAEAV